ncbi:Helicase domino-like protein [Dinothrombium tinctorium]|uniref:Helicase domino-like protein n=1 Tax=Dinothrombium tinctorium TaxID=1965070 RepID=A0A3S3Q0S5_9ACAR|nr:Helicase domino-like protein [Dinothrombium tinctorium]
MLPITTATATASSSLNNGFDKNAVTADDNCDEKCESKSFEQQQHDGDNVEEVSEGVVYDENSTTTTTATAATTTVNIVTPFSAQSSVHNQKSTENVTTITVHTLSTTTTTTNVSSLPSVLQSTKSDVIAIKRHLDDVSDNQCDRDNGGIEKKKARIDSIKCQKEVILANLETEYKRYCEMYCDHLLELFFLDQQGNLMDYYNWRKKPPTVGLLHYLRTNAVDDDDFEDLKRLKASLDASSMGVAKVTTHLHENSSSSAACVVSAPVVTSNSSLPICTSSSLSSPSTLSSVVTSRTVTTTSSISGTLTSITPTAAPVEESSSSVVPSAQGLVKTSMGATTPQPSLSNLISSTTNNKASNRQHSISAVYEASIGSQEQIVERAKQEAYVMQRITDLRKEGLWTAKRLPKVQEPPRAKAHWDYLLEEMMWLATDFAQERKWKKAAAKKCARMVMKYYQDKEMQAEKAQREEQMRLKKIAAATAKIVREFWTNVEKLVEFRQQTRLEEKRKKALDLHLNYIVDQTEKFSSWLTEGLSKVHYENGSNISSVDQKTLLSDSVSQDVTDTDFDPEKLSESDDEETIAKEEAESELVDNKSELDLLKRESEMPLDELIQAYSRSSTESSEITSQYSSRKRKLSERSSQKEDEDAEFKVEEEEEDDEETIQEQEAKEGKVDYSTELKDLENEANVPIEELLEHYKEALATDDFSEKSFTYDLLTILISKISEDEADSDDDDPHDKFQTDDDTLESCDNSVVDDSEEEEEYNECSTAESETEEIGMQFLINPEAEKRNLIEVVAEDGKKVSPSKSGPSRDITDIAAGAERIQPKGNTLLTTKVVTKIPFLLKHQLREYQHIGLDWLAAMYDKKLNGILADEMGLGKTIQTIALLAHLACDKGIWGPHLIVVPTSVMLNWEMEIKKWCPAFKILTYYGSPKERKQKRQGWTKPNQFHICITSYKLVIQDHQSFRRKKWKYLILDEAQHIKNFKSQRWQMLLNFNTSRRLLLTGTPLQNNLMELWSLMHFLMPNVFASHRDFKDWFVNPVTGMIEGSHEYNEGLIRRLHKVLRPFLLRRLKSEVEKQLPKKYEHVLYCRLSKRQRFLYEEFMNLTKTKETLSSGNFLSVINVLMQLRKVCNHPNLFESRPTVSPFTMEGITYHTPSLAITPLLYDPFKHVNLDILHSKLIEYSYNLSAFAQHRIRKFYATPKLIEEIDSAPEPPPRVPRGKIRLQIKTTTSSTQPALLQQQQRSVALRTTSTIQGIPRQFLAPQGQQFLQIASPVSQPLLQNSPRIVLLSNTNAGNTAIKTAAGSNSGIITVTEANNSANITSSSGNILKKLTITTPLTALGQSNQLGSQKVKIQIGKLVQTPSGQHILFKPVPSSPSIPVTTSTATTSVKPVLLSKPPASSPPATPQKSVSSPISPKENPQVSEFFKLNIKKRLNEERRQKLRFLGMTNALRCSSAALYAPDLIDVSTVRSQLAQICSRTYGTSVFNNGQGYFHCLHCQNKNRKPNEYFLYTETLQSLVKSTEDHVNDLREIIDRFVFVVPPVSAPRIQMHCSHPVPWKKQEEVNFLYELHQQLSPKCEILHPIVSNLRTQFPELRLIQYDCGKLQMLDQLLWKLKSEGHRVLIFTQMSRMLDIFEQFLNYHGHTYLRLDGSTKIEQRQALMERFNADKRIFCFILSTRSGGIGVNLTGADTVIFYDSDWNPTMDAQAQDRCHRIGQTRDVHIYRLISEKTVEENILKKAQQKRLLGDVAIEGGNFTTAFFKKNAIKELFDIDVSQEPHSMNVDSDEAAVAAEESQLQAQLEQALENAEEAPDIAAAKTARAEAAAEFAEFDETIPIDNDTRDSEERSPEEREMDKMIEQLLPVERYAMQFLESIQEPMQAEQLKQAEEEIEAHKKEWELGHLKSLKEEEERTAAENDSDKDEPLTISREDACQVKNRNIKSNCSKRESKVSETNGNVYVSYGGVEQMPIWAPPTPPQDENDLYIDYSIGFLYEKSVMPESQLPPVYMPKDPKRIKLDSTTTARNKQNKSRKDDVINIPRSLFDRPAPAVLKLRKEIKMQKMKGLIHGGPDPSQMQKLLASIGSNIALPQPMLTQHSAVSKQPPLYLQGFQQENHNPWCIFEDWSILQVIQYLQELPVGLFTMSLGHIPNWDLVSDAVNSVTCSYRSAKMCRHHYETIILQREEGKLLFDPSNKKLKKQSKSAQSSGTQTPTFTATSTPIKNQARPMKTSQLFLQDNNSSFTQLCHTRFDTIKQLASKRTPTLKPVFINPTGKNQKHIALLQENGINYEQPLTPMQVAAIRADRIAKEKAKNQQAVEQMQRQQRQQPMVQIKQQPQGQIKAVLTNSSNLQPSQQQQFQQAIQAKVAALSQNPCAGPKTTNYMASATANQQVANLAKALSQAAANFTSSNQQNTISPVNTILPEGTRITASAGGGTVTIPSGVQDIASQQQQQPVSNQTTGTVISVSALPQQTQQKIVAAAITPSNQITAQISTTAKLTHQQLQAYMAAGKQQLFRQQTQRFQTQQVTPQIQLQQTQQLNPQIQLQQVGSQQQVQRLQFSGNITQQSTQQNVSQQSQSLIATSAMKNVTATAVMTSGGLPVAVPLASGQQQRIFTTTTTKPQQLIARATVTEAELAQILSRGQQRTQGTVSAQPSQQNKSISLTAGLTPAQLLQAVQQQVVSQATLQQSQQGTILNQQQSTQVSQQQLLQSPVTLVKTVSAPSTMPSVTQTVTIPVSAVTMAGVNILTSQVGKVGITTTASSGSPTINAQQLRQLQLLQQKRIQLQTPQQQVHSTQHQITQVTSSQQQQTVNTQTQQKIAAALQAGQGKTLTQIPSGLGTIQIVHQAPSGSGQTQTQTKTIPAVTMQQLQQVIKQGGLVLPSNLPHAIHVTQSPSSGGTTAHLIQQSLLQAMTQNKLQQQQSAASSESSQSQATVTSSPITVAQINPSNQPSSNIKHFQVVATTQPSSQTTGAKNIVIGNQAQAILQAATLQPTQTPTLTFAIRTSAAPQSQIQTQSQQQTSTINVSTTNANSETTFVVSDELKKDEVQITSIVSASGELGESNGGESNATTQSFVTRVQSVTSKHQQQQQ